jgi:cytosine/adenosine deaminase-related metal-dependent hydrolase
VVCYRAEWLLPVAREPLQGGFVAVDGGLIRSLGTEPPPACVDLGRAVVLPSLVNAHTHLELSHLRGLVPPAPRLVDWVRRLLERRRTQVDPAGVDVRESVRRAIAEARASGTGLVGDVANTLVTIGPLREDGMPARVFHELIGFGRGDYAAQVREARAALDAAGGAPNLRVSIAAHAPYSVAPGLFEAIRADLDTRAGDVTSVHLGESPEETEFVGRGAGAWRDLLVELGAWNDDWTPHGGSAVAYLADLGFLDARVLAVHGVQFTGDDLARLRRLGTTVVSCPRSNRHVGVGAPPLESFFAQGVPVALGTDSLASVADLNMFEELAEARRVAPRVPARALLDAATRQGARALGFGDDLGSIEPGKRASLIAVRVPDGVSDVEEYLVSGVAPDRVTWLAAG